MEVIEGPVRQVRTGTEVSANNGQASTTHLATFMMGRTPVRVEATKLIMIHDGDEVAVAGEQGKDGVFRGLAYRNRATGVRGDNDHGAVALTVVYGLAVVAWTVVCGGLLAAAFGHAAEGAVVGGFAAVFALAFTAAARTLQRARAARTALD